jgi:hypothetical protein
MFRMLGFLVRTESPMNPTNNNASTEVPIINGWCAIRSSLPPRRFALLKFPGQRRVADQLARLD